MKTSIRETRNRRFVVAEMVVTALLVTGSTSPVPSAVADDDVWSCSAEDATGFKKIDGR